MPQINQMNRLRIYHAILAISVIAAYFNTQWGRNHSIIGYIVAILIFIRILMMLSGAPQLGLMRFYPHFSDLRLDHFMTQPAISKTILLLIALSLLTVTSTGLIIDNGRTVNRIYLTAIGKSPPVRSQNRMDANISNKENPNKKETKESNHKGEKENILGEVHETAGNLLMIFVILHVCYLLLFKRPLAKFMLFVLPKKGVKLYKSDLKS